MVNESTIAIEDGVGSEAAANGRFTAVDDSGASLPIKPLIPVHRKPFMMPQSKLAAAVAVVLLLVITNLVTTSIVVSLSKDVNVDSSSGRLQIAGTDMPVKVQARCEGSRILPTIPPRTT